MQAALLGPVKTFWPAQLLLNQRKTLPPKSSKGATKEGTAALNYSIKFNITAAISMKSKLKSDLQEVQQTTAKGAGKPVSSNHTTSAQTRGPVTLAIPVQTPKSEK